MLGKLDHYFIPYTKANSKWIKGLNAVPETVKLLEDNIGGKVFDIALCDVFLDLTPKAVTTTTNINECNFMKPKNFCTVKETTNKAKRQPTEWQKTFGDHISSKGLISKIDKELIELNNNPTEKWTEHLNRHFFQSHSHGQQAHEMMLNITNH